MKANAKTFSELTTTELFEIIRARLAVFVVEQNCIYQDLDDRDYRSLHVFYQAGSSITAYLRIYQDEQDGIVRMGRVLTTRRGESLGLALLKDGIALCRSHFGAQRVDIEAQCYATGFYEKVGFQICSDPFLDDGIPHVQMYLDLTASAQR